MTEQAPGKIKVGGLQLGLNEKEMKSQKNKDLPIPNTVPYVA